MKMRQHNDDAAASTASPAIIQNAVEFTVPGAALYAANLFAGKKDARYLLNYPTLVIDRHNDRARARIVATNRHILFAYRLRQDHVHGAEKLLGDKEIERLAAQASYITDYDSRTGAFLTMETASKKSPLGYDERQASIFSYWLPAVKGLDSRRCWR